MAEITDLRPNITVMFLRFIPHILFIEVVEL